MKVEKIKCPMCKGAGEVVTEQLRKEQRDRRTYKVAKQLRAEGYSFREIAALMGYASPNSVSVLLNKSIK